MIFCRARLVTMDETWLYHYDPETKQQSMGWRHSGSLRPQKIRVQKSAGKVLASNFFWIKTATSSLIIFQRAKLSTRSITHLCWLQLKDILKEKGRGTGRSPRGPCSCTTMARLTGHLQPRGNCPYLGFQCLDHPPNSPYLSPSDYLFPGLKKTIESSPFFVRRGGHCCRGDLVGRTPL